MATRKLIEEIGKSSYIAVVTGFWYEWSLAVPEAFGIDFAKRTVTLFDEGETKISTSTMPQVHAYNRQTLSWPKRLNSSYQVGRAVAALLSLPIKPSVSINKDAPCLSNLANKVVYINSFTISQKDMFASALRVTGTKEADWTITKEPTQSRYASGTKEMKEGKRIGFAKMIYSRCFYPDGCGDFEQHKGTLNALLDLPEEDMDEATKAAINRAKTTDWVNG